MNRRSFLTALGVTAAASACRAPTRAMTPVPSPRGVGPVGLQLYTVRNQMQADMPGTIARVAAVGYREVEFAGYFGRTPAQVKALLAQHDLTSPSTHLPLELLQKGGWEKAVAESKEIGHQWVTIAYVDASFRKTGDDWKRLGEMFTRAAEQANAAGLRFAYHNHDFEFPLVDGSIPLATLLHNTDPARVDFEMDVYWLTKAGHDPVTWFQAHPGRFRMLHLKDAGPAPERAMLPVGSGTIDWRRVLAARPIGGVQHVFVEHDNPTDPMASIRASREYLATLDR
jgi:sugar phosphate isomerase/epimerase